MANSTLMFSGFLVLALVTIASGKFCDLKFTDCGSTKGKVYSVQINETCTGEEGVLEKGTNVRINFTFSANSDETALSSKVYGKIGGLPVFIPFPLENPNACKDSGLACPITANKKYQYLPLLEVKSSYPAVKALVKWELQDTNGDDVFCVELVAHISDKL